LKVPNLYELADFDDFESKVAREEAPVLVLCLERSTGFDRQMGVAKKVLETYIPPLKLFFLREEFIGPFSKKFDVKGTPTFLLFLGGMEKGRMLGHTNEDTMEAFLSETLGST